MPAQDESPAAAVNGAPAHAVLDEKTLRSVELPSPSSLPDHPQTKDSPLTDIGTSPPPFEMPPLEKRASSRDSYESSELSDLGDDESEAETDKMDFLNDETSSGPGDTVSDLHRLSNLSELARLQDLDDSDSDDAPDRYVANLRSAANSAVGSPHNPPADAATPSAAAEPLPKRRKLASSDVSVPTSPAGSDFEPEHASAAAPLKDEPSGDISAAAKLEQVENAEQDVSAKHIPDVDDANKSDMPESEAGLEADLEADLEDGNSADVEDVVKQEPAEDDQVQDGEEQPEVGADAESDADPDLDLDEHRESAVKELISIENDFSYLRDKLFQDKLSLLERELQLCLEGSHPELLQLYYKFNEFYQDNIKLANSTLNYSLKCINNETIATRTGIHQNFMKDLADSRNDMITETTSLWYKINKEWNYLDSAMADYNYTALPSLTPEAMTMPVVAGGHSLEYYQDGAVSNKKIAKQNTIVELVHQRNCLNEQLGILNGLKEFHGIPCAVSSSLLDDDAGAAEELLLRKASPEEIKDDLQAMGIY